jgi:ankyrin repeat protein
MTPLHLATQSRHTALVEQLVAAGASVKCAGKEGMTPLLTAIGCTRLERGRPELVAFLLDAGANMDCTLLGKTPCT